MQHPDAVAPQRVELAVLEGEGPAVPFLDRLEAGSGRVVCIVSGGNIDLSTLAPILLGYLP